MRSEKEIKQKLEEVIKILIEKRNDCANAQDHETAEELEIIIRIYEARMILLKWILEGEPTKCKKYELVNQCETLDELANAILSFADEKGMIKGRTKSFNAESMAEACRNYSFAIHNSLTREFGIRQQALMILLYNQRNNLKDL